MAAAWLVLASAVVGSAYAQADVPFQSPSTPQSTEWVTGPATANLGSIAGIKVPEGYKFADSAAARAFFEKLRNPVPPNLVGILAPQAGGMWIIFEFAEVGFLKDADRERLDNASILKTVQSRIERQNKERTLGGQAPFSTVDWQLKPIYDAQQHTLEWAIRADSSSENVVNQTLRLLARRGVLDAIAIRSGRDTVDLNQLRQLVKGVSLKPGEAYADYREGDKLAVSGLAQLITGENAPRQPILSIANAEVGGTSESRMFWIGLAVFVCVGGAGTLLVMRKVRRQKKVTAAAPISAQPQTVGEADTKVNGTKGRLAVGRPRAPVIAPAQPQSKKMPATKLFNSNHNGMRRRRVFNYQKFYTEMVLQVSPATRANGGYEGEPEKTAVAAPTPSPEVRTFTQASIFDANSDMIGYQRNLIEEQKRLISEQTKLIEEKSKLIAEKNALLERQSEMIDNNLL
jgi:uncharacterized membrane-anchored protein